MVLQAKIAAEPLCRVMSAVAKTATPSPRPVKPMPSVLVAVTETVTEADIAAFAAALKEVLA